MFTKFDFSLGFKDAREICVFPIYLLRGHVACNRFSFHDPLATTTRIERRFRRISRFEWSFFLLFPPLFFYARTTFLFDPSRGQGLSSSTRNGREPPVMDRRFIPFDCNDGINSVSNRRRFRRGKQKFRRDTFFSLLQLLSKIINDSIIYRVFCIERSIIRCFVDLKNGLTRFVGQRDDI